MGINIKKTDSIIFDMDGTLWNATNSYALIWNQTCEFYGIKSSFSGADLEKFMGMRIEEILDNLLGYNIPISKKSFLKTLGENENQMMPLLGGILFEGVKEGLDNLHKKYRLFMMSNCSARGLINFTLFTGTSSLFSGLLTQGERPVSKSENLRYMSELYSLVSPVYVGDTQSDCDQAHLAHMPFVHAKYGFGRCENPDFSCNNFNEIVDFFMRTD